MQIFVSLDLETTWVHHFSDKIIEYAFVKFNAETFEVLDTFSGFVNPQIPIPDVIEQLTHIKDEDVSSAPLFQDIISDIEDFIAWYTLVWHNVMFDINFLKSAWVSVSHNPIIDTFLLANYLCIWVPSLSLSSLCSHYNIELNSAHRALDDTYACVNLLEKLSHRLADISMLHGEILQHIFSRSSEPWDTILYNLYIKPQLSGQKDWKQLSQIHKSHCHDLIYSFDSVDSSTPLENNSYEYIQRFPWYEYRESQKMMSDIVDKVFTKQSKVAIEAPTWTWKTFSYLVSALIHCKKCASQVCIATQTKVLQKQIYDQDLAFLKEYLPFSFSYIKLMWRNNYFSLSAYHNYLALFSSLSQAQWCFFLKLYLWSITTESWELQELEYYGEEFTHIAHINAISSDNYELFWDLRGEFYLQARKNAEQADLIITNSSVVIQDMQAGSHIFWEIDTIIFDEAHTLEDVVTQACTKKLSSKHIEIFFDTLKRKLQKHKINISISYDDINFKITEILFECSKIASKQTYYNAKYKKYLFKKQDIENVGVLKNTANTLLHLLKWCEDTLWWLEYKNYFHYEIHELTRIQKLIFDVFVSPDFHTYMFICDISQPDNIEISYSVLSTWKYLSNELWSQKKHILLTSASLFTAWNEIFEDTLLWIWWFEKHVLPQVFDYKHQAEVYILKEQNTNKNKHQLDIEFLHEFFKVIGWRWLMLCTSYVILKQIYVELSSRLERENINIIVQWFSWWKNKHLETYKQHYYNSILVWTDSFWQWIDLPWDMLEYLIIQKIPFSPPSDPIFQARAWLFQNGFYGYAIPKASLKLRQWFWRLIRSKNDYGSIILLDTRIVSETWWNIFIQLFPEDINIHYIADTELLQVIKKWDRI